MTLLIVGSVLLVTSIVFVILFEIKISKMLTKERNGLELRKEKGFFYTKLIFRTLYTIFIITGIGLMIF